MDPALLLSGLALGISVVATVPGFVALRQTAAAREDARREAELTRHDVSWQVRPFGFGLMTVRNTSQRYGARDATISLRVDHELVEQRTAVVGPLDQVMLTNPRWEEIYQKDRALIEAEPTKRRWLPRIVAGSHVYSLTVTWKTEEAGVERHFVADGSTWLGPEV